MRKRIQKRIGRFLCASLCLLAAISFADSEFDPKSATFDELIYHVQRYGNTEEKRATKALAREELFGRRPDALRAMMESLHVENVMIGVLARNMVDEWDTEEVAPILVESLSSPDEKTRKIAVFFLGLNDTPEYADKIIPFLDEDLIAGAAMRTLGKWGVKSAFTNIVPFLSHERELRRVPAVNALRDIGDAAAVPYLIPLLSDEVFTVREVASRALVSFGDPAEEALLEALATAEEPALRQIIRALGELNSEKAVETLQELLNDSDPLVRRDAEAALAQINAAD